MDEIRNLIPQTQNNDESRQYLAASCYFTWIVKRLAKWQLILTVLVPVALSISAVRFPSVRTWAALYGIAISIIDVSLIERKLREWKIDSAKIQECFDCKILNIAWNGIKVGGKPEREKISSAYEKFGQKCDNEIDDWFTTEIAALPLPLARIIGQRINTWWPTAMRRKYLWWLQFIFIALCVSALAVGVAVRMGMDALILAVLAPISPTILWFIREIRKQKETSAKLEGLMGKIEAIWDKALGGGLTKEQLEEKARQFQDETYDFRCTYQPINSSVYKFLRKDFPKRMQTTVTGMVREALRTLKSGSDVNLIEKPPPDDESAEIEKPPPDRESAEIEKPPPDDESAETEKPPPDRESAEIEKPPTDRESAE